MERVVSCVPEDKLSAYTSLREPSLKSKEDIATLIEVFEDAMNQQDSSSFVGVMCAGKSFVIVYKSGYVSSWNILSFIKENYSGEDSDKIGILNVKLLCPKAISRGLWGGEVIKQYSSNGEEGIATGYFGDDDEDLIARNRGQEESRKLLIMSEGTQIPIDENGVVIGRASTQCDYAILNPKISRRHARVYKKGSKYYIHDYSSANGTFVDGLKVTESADREVTIGSKIQLADEVLRLL